MSEERIYVYWVSYAVQTDSRFGFGGKMVEMPFPLNEEQSVTAMRVALHQQVERERGEECNITPLWWTLIRARVTPQAPP